MCNLTIPDAKRGGDERLAFALTPIILSPQQLTVIGQYEYARPFIHVYYTYETP